MSTANGTLTSNASSPVFRAGPKRSSGSFNTLYASGTFDGGTLQVQASPDGSNWFDVIDANLSATGTLNFEIMAEQLRVNLSGASSPSVDWWVV